MTKLTDKAELYSIDIPSGWHIETYSGPDEEAHQYSHIYATSPDFKIDDESLGLNRRMYIDTGVMLVLDAYASDTCTGGPFPLTYYVTPLQTEQVATASNDQWRLKTEQETGYVHDMRYLTATMQRDTVCYAFVMLYNSTNHPQGKNDFIVMLKSVRFAR